MNDKELLGFAAKAAGINGDYVEDDDWYGTGIVYTDTDDCNQCWNPLTDDGDALRLAVDLQLGISVPPVVDGRIDVVTFYGPIISVIEYPKNNDRQEPTRRAIVRAAAEIGKDM